MGITMNKRGVSALMLVAFVFVIFFAMIFLVALIFGFNQIEAAFSSIDLQIGDVNFNQSYNDTLAPAFVTINEISDNAGVLLIFGMIVVMIIIGFIFSNNRLWIILDIFVIVVSFILAVYISRAYNDFINSSPELLEISSTTLSTSSTLLLNLPFIIVISGALVMIMTYGILRKREEFFR